ncbi:hypothetical protein IAU60_004268 [Kwoniella sp. DSM 27419]
MPHLTSSPISSPSLRSIAHAQLRSSYFPSVPSAHSYHSRAPPTPQSSLNVGYHVSQPAHASALVGCLKHPQNVSGRPPSSAQTAQEHKYHTGVAEYYPLRPALKSSNAQEKQRSSMEPMKVSNIPMGHPARAIHASTPQQASARIPTAGELAANTAANARVTEPARRRPSFKIELPPRPAQSPVKSTMTNSYLPPSHTVASATAHPTVACATPAAYPNRSGAPVFRDPFAAYAAQPSDARGSATPGGYVILRAPTRSATVPTANGNGRFYEDLPSPTQVDGVWQEGMSGLGYSLNRLRAPTPWLRGRAQEEDVEWLMAEDVEAIGANKGLEHRVRGLGFA